MKTLGLSLLSLSLLAGACAEEEELNYDEAQLAVYRNALPTRAAMSRRLLTFGSGSVPSTRPFAPRQQHC